MTDLVRRWTARPAKNHGVLVKIAKAVPSGTGALPRRKNDPAHESWFARFDRRQAALRNRLDEAMERLYRPLLERAVRHRYLTTAVFVAALVVAAGYTASGRIDFAFRPTIETSFIQAEIEMPSGTPVSRTREVAFQVEAAAKRALERTGEKDILVGFFVEVAERS